MTGASPLGSVRGGPSRTGRGRSPGGAAGASTSTAPIPRDSRGRAAARAGTRSRRRSPMSDRPAAPSSRCAHSLQTMMLESSRVMITPWWVLSSRASKNCRFQRAESACARCWRSRAQRPTTRDIRAATASIHDGRKSATAGARSHPRWSSPRRQAPTRSVTREWASIPSEASSVSSAGARSATGRNRASSEGSCAFARSSTRRARKRGETLRATQMASCPR